MRKSEVNISSKSQTIMPSISQILWNIFRRLKSQENYL